MKQLSGRVFADRVFALCGLSFLLAAVCMAQLVHAQEELPCPPPLAGGRLNIADHPIFSKLPLAPDYLHRVLANDKGEIIIHLTKMSHTGEACNKSCSGPACCEETLAHYGCGAAAVEHPTANITARFLRFGCPGVAPGECNGACEATACGAQCAAAKDDTCKCCPCADRTDEATCGEENCEVANILVQRVQHVDELDEHHPLKLMQHIAGLVGEKAAAQAALAVRKEADDQIGELMETMAELLADNAALDAKLEAAAEQRKLLDKMTDLAAENARLKAHVELTAERVELARNSAALTLENERLKLHVAELEQKHALAEAARTAAKPKERKAR
jgi:hypothetical protein